MKRRLSGAAPWLALLAVLGALVSVGVGVNLEAFVGSLFAAAASVFAILFLEAQLRPCIDFEIEAPVDQPGRRFLRVLVHNRAMPLPLRPFLDRRPALLTRAWVTFLTEDHQPVFTPGHRMRARWPRTREPVRPMALKEGGEIISLWDPTVTTDFMDVPAGSFEPLDIVMRTREEETCRGWHNGTIQRPNPPSDEVFELSRGRYLALIHVDTGGRRFRTVVRIVNDQAFEHFRLDPVDPQPPLGQHL